MSFIFHLLKKKKDQYYLVPGDTFSEGAVKGLSYVRGGDRWGWHPHRQVNRSLPYSAGNHLKVNKWGAGLEWM